MPRGPGRDAQTSLVVRRLGEQLYHVLSGEDGNLVLSPWAIATAMALVVSGARGRTEGEILRLLGVADGLRYARDVAVLRRVVQQAGVGLVDPVVLLLGQTGSRWNGSFLTAVQQAHGARLQEFDFAGDPEAAGRVIRLSAEDREHLGRDTRFAVLARGEVAVPWSVPFVDSDEPRPFAHPAAELAVPVMTSVLTTRIGEGDGWRTVRLPLGDGSAALSIVLPEPGGLRRVESLLAAGGLIRLLRTDRTAVVRVRVPRWTSAARPPVQDAVQGLGVQTVFTSTADLRGIASDGPLRLDRLLHHPRLRVDAVGLGAGVLGERAPGGPEADRAAPVPAERFRVDRPFLFVVHTIRHQVPLLAGRVVDPRG